MAGGILVVNAGSSSVKFAAFAERGEDDPALLGRGQVDGLRTRPRFVCKSAAGGVIGEQRWPQPIGHDAAIKHIIAWIGQQSTAGPLVAAGHRVVFGGADLVAPTLVDDALLAKVEALVPFFPLHLPHNLAALRAVTAMDPALPQVACFDNAFHRTYLPEARLFALPRRLTDLGVRRYGFHGLSFESVVSELSSELASRTVIAHLGSGASLVALLHGRPVDTTMGLTPTGGVMMGTRSGDLDPGVLLYLLREKRLDVERLERLVNEEAGLRGVSGTTSDMRTLLEERGRDRAADIAVSLFCRGVCKAIGSLAAALGGLDQLVFTGAIGERSEAVRREIISQLGHLNVTDGRTPRSAGGCRVRVVATNENLVIARHVHSLLVDG